MSLASELRYIADFLKDEGVVMNPFSQRAISGWADEAERLEAQIAALRGALERTVDALVNGLKYGAHKADDYDQAQVRRVCKNAAAALSADAMKEEVQA